MSRDECENALLILLYLIEHRTLWLSLLKLSYFLSIYTYIMCKVMNVPFYVTRLTIKVNAKPNFDAKVQHFPPH